MALQVWLPLNGDLKNLGLDDISVINNGAAVSTTGKIGSCYNGTSSSQTIVATVPDLASMLANGGKYSFACWVKMNATAANTNQWIVKLGTNTCGFWWGYDSPRFVWNENDNGKRVANGETTAWHHFVVVVDKTISGRITTWNYMDGTPVSGRESYSWDSSSQVQPTGNTITIYPYMALVNDLRIYDHALSQKEIKLLSQGLVAHYPLNDGIGGENIAWNSSLATDLTNWAKTGTWDFVTKDGFPCCHNTGAFKTTSLIYPKQTFNTTTNGMLPYNGLIITLSADVLLENVVKGTTNYFLALYKSGETIDGSWKAPTILANSGHFTSVTSEALEPSKLNGKGWTHVWVTFKWGDYAWSNTNYRLQFYARDYTGDVYIKNFKIELGEKATPWIPNPNDALYSTLGLNDGVVHDCSGYGHDGTVTGKLIADSDTPRYSISTYFDGSSYAKTLSGELSWTNFETMTVSAWIKPTQTPSNWVGGIGIAHDSGSNYKCFSINNYGGKFTVSTSDGGWVNIQSPYIMPLNEWHHYAATLDNTTVKMYVDGEPIYTATIDWKTATIHAKPQIQIGVDLPGTDEKYMGYYSDIRIYATALSAEDVKNLYETTASIDDHNNIYAHELWEA